MLVMLFFDFFDIQNLQLFFFETNRCWICISEKVRKNCHVFFPLILLKMQILEQILHRFCEKKNLNRKNPNNFAITKPTTVFLKQIDAGFVLAKKSAKFVMLFFEKKNELKKPCHFCDKKNVQIDS